MNTKKRRTEELLGQSLHEDLDPSQREQLDRLLERQPALCNEAAEMRRFVERVAGEPLVFTGDLRPAVMAELSRRGPRRSVFIPRWMLAVAAFVMVASGVIYWIAAHSPAAVAPAIPVALDAPTIEASPALAEAEALIASRRYAQAYAALAEAVEAAPRSADAALAVQKMSDLAYAELQWYPEAYAGYDRLRRDYTEQFRASESNFTRLNLLDEARGVAGDYASLRALDAARRDGGFEAYEIILAKYPATYVASEAADELAMAVASAEGIAPGDFNRVRALRMAAFRAKDPVARAQLRLEVAHEMRGDPARADEVRRIYQEIAVGPYTTLAELARKSLTTMDSAEAQRGHGL